MLNKNSQSPIARLIDEGIDLGLDVYRAHKIKKKLDKFNEAIEGSTPGSEEHKAVSPTEVANLFLGKI